MVQLGSIGGALIATYTVDKLGRIRALQFVCLIWVVGAIIQITSHSVGQLYAGRLIEGLAVGQTTSIGPAYLSECAPRSIRGLCVCIFSGAVYFGVMIAYFANYGTSIHMEAVRNQWVVPTSMKIVFAGLLFILSFAFCVESPRWLLKTNKPEQALKNLSKLRHLPENHPYIASEISDINEQVLQEKEAVEGSNFVSKLKELTLFKSNRYRFFAVCALAQILGQWSGANAITIYAPEFFELSGIEDKQQLKMTAVLGVVKFISAYLLAFLIIDALGRKAALQCGLIIQLVTTLFFAIFLTIVPQAAEEGAVLTHSQLQASKAALASLFLSGVGWTMGFNNIQYLVGSEMFPLNIRSFAQSLVMVLHFACQYGNSRAVPKMLLAMNSYGAFYFFSAVIVISLFWGWFFIPEVSGRSLESMEDIFNLPWYLIGRRGPELCPDYSELSRIGHASKESFGQGIIDRKVEVEQISNVLARSSLDRLNDDDNDKEKEKEKRED
ncbi:uncharacterized protein PRCAT00006333001 [Priceomyces carsonii]|uniref:uncharacterized protein n=1 Tax=Priceomyces carsonii TaxID=28549 RepID=UPI002ED7F02C|nr:unnamed protein product [Priceomyces carsonii]